MWPVSDAFLSAVKAGDQSATVEVKVVDPDTNDELVLEVLSGGVTSDRTRDVRRTVTARLTDPTGTLTPAAATDLLSPFGNELHAARGVTFDDGSVELVPLGVFRLTDFTVEDGPAGVTIDLEGSDRSLVVQRARWEAPYVVAAGQAFETAVADLVTDRFPAVETNLPTLGGSTPKQVLDGSEGDPWRDAQKLARARGYELWFDGSGVLVASKPATPDGTPVISYQEGAQAVLLDLSRQVSTAASVFNGVVAEAEHTDLDAPLRSVVWDDDPGSPTYFLGKFGKVPRKWSTPLVTTQAQLDEAAQSLLDGILGANEDVAFGQIVNPALESNDVIQVTRTRAGLDAVRVVVDVVTVPLTAGEPMAVSGRRRFL